MQSNQIIRSLPQSDAHLLWFKRDSGVLCRWIPSHGYPSNSTPPRGYAAAEVRGGYLTYGLASLTLSFIVIAVRQYIRSRYPCITVQELTDKEQNLDALYLRGAPMIEQLPSYATELENISGRTVILKNRASRMRCRALQLVRTSSPIWKIYFGVHSRMASSIVAWYNDVEDLERDIMAVIESIAQHRFESQLARRGSVSDAPYQSQEIVDLLLT
uniref:Uncharacterized protein n=1 Tax=Moniliophthora roreri TaxID=221103 RepID=A0A0W0G2E7_MONRR